MDRNKIRAPKRGFRIRSRNRNFTARPRQENMQPTESPKPTQPAPAVPTPKPAPPVVPAPAVPTPKPVEPTQPAPAVPVPPVVIATPKPAQPVRPPAPRPVVQKPPIKPRPTAPPLEDLTRGTYIDSVKTTATQVGEKEMPLRAAKKLILNPPTIDQVAKEELKMQLTNEVAATPAVNQAPKPTPAVQKATSKEKPAKKKFLFW